MIFLIKQDTDKAGCYFFISSRCSGVLGYISEQTCFPLLRLVSSFVGSSAFHPISTECMLTQEKDSFLLSHCSDITDTNYLFALNASEVSGNMTNGR